MRIEFPTRYMVNIPGPNERYYNDNHKYKIKAPLIKACASYCMYCGKTMQIDSDIVAHLEHSVDKEGNRGQGKEETTFLKHCKFNFSAACPTCNDECKKIIEKINFDYYEKNLNCFSKSCSSPCEPYCKARKEYTRKNAIMLQPYGIGNDDQSYRIYYNLLKHIFEPAANSVEGLFMVQNHIDRFQLNGSRFTECIIELSSAIVDLYNCGFKKVSDIFRHYQGVRFENILEYVYLDFLRDQFINRDIEELVEFCSLIVLLDALD